MPQIGKFFLFLTVLAISILVLSYFLDFLFNSINYSSKTKYGVTFSQKQARQLSLDWVSIYVRILDELGVKQIRISSYWDEIEKIPSNYYFEDLDFMLAKAKERNVKVILTLGARQPRRPECHIPEWAENLKIKERQDRILQFIGKVLDRYKGNDIISAWQVENEPLFGFFREGCDSPDVNFLKKEVEFVRKLDKRPIIITDSGEIGFWINAMRLSDIFGTTVYHKVYDKMFGLGYINYPIPPFFYSLKSTFVRAIFAQNNQKTIISELQTEPLLPNNDFTNTPLSAQLQLFSVSNFKQYLDHARRTGFDTIYLLGAEWWYFMKSQGYPEYWEYAKSLFKQQV